MKRILIILLLSCSNYGLSQNLEKALALKASLKGEEVSAHFSKQDIVDFSSDWFISSEYGQMIDLTFCGKKLDAFENISNGFKNIEVNSIVVKNKLEAKVKYKVYPLWKKIECSTEVPNCTNYLFVEITAYLSKRNDEWVLLREELKDIDFESWIFLSGVKCLRESYIPLN